MPTKNDITKTVKQIKEKLGEEKFVVVLYSTKAGTGKTTLTQNLAHFFSITCKLNVTAIDSCPAHESLSVWEAQRRAQYGSKPDHNNAPYTIIKELSANDLPMTIDKIDSDITLIDVGGSQEAIAGSAAPASDIVIIPTSDSRLEFDRVDRAIDAIEFSVSRPRSGSARGVWSEENPSGVQIAVALSRTSPNGKNILEGMKEYFSKDRKDGSGNIIGKAVSVIESPFSQRRKQKTFASNWTATSAGLDFADLDNKEPEFQEVASFGIEVMTMLLGGVTVEPCHGGQ